MDMDLIKEREHRMPIEIVFLDDIKRQFERGYRRLVFFTHSRKSVKTYLLAKKFKRGYSGYYKDFRKVDRMLFEIKKLGSVQFDIIKL